MAEVTPEKLMTGAEIKAALAPMLQFAPAMMNARRIVEAAEDAEKRLAAMTRDETKLKSTLAAEIASLEGSRNTLAATANKERNDFKAFTDDVAAKKNAMKADLNKAREEMDAAIAELEAKKKAKIKEIADIEAVRREQQSVFDALKAEFDAWKRERKLA